MDYDRRTKLACARAPSSGGRAFAVDCMRRVLFPRPVKTTKGKESAQRSTTTSVGDGAGSLVDFAKSRPKTTAADSVSMRSGAGDVPHTPALATSTKTAQPRALATRTSRSWSVSRVLTPVARMTDTADHAHGAPRVNNEYSLILIITQP